jgi:hypothetical protein
LQTLRMWNDASGKKNCLPEKNPFRSFLLIDILKIEEFYVVDFYVFFYLISLILVEFYVLP